MRGVLSVAGGVGALLLLGLVGCASAPPPVELQAARLDYERARASRAAELAPDALRDARQALERAEHAFAYDAKSEETRGWAYIADRAAREAEVQARTVAFGHQRMAAVAAYQAAQAELARRAEQTASQRAAELSRVQGELGEVRRQLAAQREQLASQGRQVESGQGALREEREARARREAELAAAEARLEERAQRLQEATTSLEQERRARAEAEQRASDALTRLREAGSVREEARGTVITIPGSVLFRSGASALMPESRERLAEVADALRSAPEGTVIIEGHADSVGPEDANQQLSQRRAEEVRVYLIERGMPADRIIAVGRGESQPLASNDSAEGRAMNRRVEIILPRAGTTAAPGSGQQPAQRPETPSPQQPRPEVQQPATPQRTPEAEPQPQKPEVAPQPQKPEVTPPEKTPETDNPYE